MSLLSRVQEATTCRVVECARTRVTESLFCAEHLNDMWRNRLDRQPDGSFVPRRVFAPRDLTDRRAVTA